jgi:hypothetical protein
MVSVTMDIESIDTNQPSLASVPVGYIVPVNDEHGNLKFVMYDGSNWIPVQIPEVEIAQGLETSSGTIFGKRYYTASPNDARQWGIMTSWMYKTFGPSGTPNRPGCWTPNERWYANDSKFWIRDDKDWTLFLLRWS